MTASRRRRRSPDSLTARPPAREASMSRRALSPSPRGRRAVSPGPTSPRARPASKRGTPATPAPKPVSSCLSVFILHPDLGVGGAERLIVDAAVVLAAAGHQVTMFTAHHDPKHCFEETVDGAKGTATPVAARVGFVFDVPGCGLSETELNGLIPGQGASPCASTVTFCRGTSLGAFPPARASADPHIPHRRLHALCAYLRCVWCALAMLVHASVAGRPAVIMLDGVSAPTPLLRLSGAKVIFYCHYPDKLLAPRGAGLLRLLYRRPLDALEEATTGAAHAVLVNSAFTAAAYATAFPRLAGRAPPPTVLHPAVDVDAYAESAAIAPGTPAATAGLNTVGLLTIVYGPTPRGPPQPPPPLFLSLNRFERKKRLGLALEALADLGGLTGGPPPSRGAARARLVIAGGYDERVAENVAHLSELRAVAEALGITHRVAFLPSISAAQKRALLAAATAVVYTPPDEHFGIVPLEAAASARPVIACDSGGPRESIISGVTGHLCAPTPEAFGAAMRSVLDPALGAAMGTAARRRAVAMFGREAFGERLNAIVGGLARGAAAGGARGGRAVTRGASPRPRRTPR